MINCRQQRMSYPAGIERSCSSGEFRKYISRMLKGISGQRCQRFKFAHNFQPGADRWPEFQLPALRGENDLRAPKREKIERLEKSIVPLLQILGETCQLADRDRRRNAVSLQSDLKRRHTRRLKLFLLDQGEHACEYLQIFRRLLQQIGSFLQPSIDPVRPGEIKNRNRAR